ncbi:hypothetical protein ACFSF0_11735 [Ottowia flava]|uniref:Uncharacterized protein n=1 Tax=Ottowia flava TaxID=2675430 RepID=A0ABW4KTB4_9BURK
MNLLKKHTNQPSAQAQGALAALERVFCLPNSPAWVDGKQRIDFVKICMSPVRATGQLTARPLAAALAPPFFPGKSGCSALCMCAGSSCFSSVHVDLMATFTPGPASTCGLKFFKYFCADVVAATRFGAGGDRAGAVRPGSSGDNLVRNHRQPALALRKQLSNQD